MGMILILESLKIRANVIILRYTLYVYCGVVSIFRLRTHNRLFFNVFQSNSPEYQGQDRGFHRA